MSVVLVRRAGVALTRLRGWYALAVAEFGRGAPAAPELDERIIAAIRRTQRPSQGV